MEAVLETILVGKVEDFEDPGKKVVQVGEDEYGVFCLGGEFFAWKNECPHQGGPVCQGRIFKRVVEVIGADNIANGRDYADDGRTNIVCPWHGMEFDIRTGEFPGNKDMALQGANVQVQGGDVLIVV
jgi:nitrite reductase (NADH) small subunit